MKALIILLCIALAEAKSYTNYRLLRTTPQTEEQLAFLTELSETTHLDIDFWMPPTKLNRSCEFLISPESFSLFKFILDELNIKLEVLSNNIQQAIDEEKQSSTNSSLYSSDSYGLTDTYATYAQIVQMMTDFANKYSHAKFITYGSSYEGRKLHGIKFSSGSGKKGIFIESGMHSMEWIGIASIVKIIERFATEYDSDTDIITLLNMYDWIFVPVSNPDGYYYTHHVNRIWRKNRRPTNLKCVGTDLNRNFDSGWGDAASSYNPCSLTYRGTSVFSEPESSALKSLVMSSRPLIGFFSVHSYKQFILTPYGYTTRKPTDTAELTSLAYKAARAMASVNGLSFTVGTPPELLYRASGRAFDWAKLKVGVKYCYAFQLRPAQKSTGNKYIQPAKNIKPSSLELFAALNTFAHGFR